MVKQNTHLIIYDENNNILEEFKQRTGGSGCYTNKMFKCSKCYKLYCTLGALRYYHKKHQINELYPQKNISNKPQPSNDGYNSSYMEGEKA